MPNCFNFVNKETGEIPTLPTIDEELCAHLDTPCHPTKWVCGWMDSIGLSIAIGRKLPDIATEYKDELAKAEANGDQMDIDYYTVMLHIAIYLRDKYDTNAWYQPR